MIPEKLPEKVSQESLGGILNEEIRQGEKLRNLQDGKERISGRSLYKFPRDT